MARVFPRIRHHASSSPVRPVPWPARCARATGRAMRRRPSTSVTWMGSRKQMSAVRAGSPSRRTKLAAFLRPERHHRLRAAAPHGAQGHRLHRHARLDGGQENARMEGPDRMPVPGASFRKHAHRAPLAQSAASSPAAPRPAIPGCRAGGRWSGPAPPASRPPASRGSRAWRRNPSCAGCAAPPIDPADVVGHEQRGAGQWLAHAPQPEAEDAHQAPDHQRTATSPAFSSPTRIHTSSGDRRCRVTGRKTNRWTSSSGTRYR